MYKKCLLTPRTNCNQQKIFGLFTFINLIHKQKIITIYNSDTKFIWQARDNFNIVDNNIKIA